MRYRSLLLIIIIALEPGTGFSFQATSQQPGQSPLSFDPLINRAREALSLSVDQVSELRRILQQRTANILLLRRRAQAPAQMYSPQLQAEIEVEHRAIREELTSHLNEDQKAKLAGVDLRPVPQPPQFLLINIPPRAGLPVAYDFAENERTFPGPAANSKARLAHLSDDQRILHTLNRVTFGPRPGEIAVIRHEGLDRFIERQLSPELIDDFDLESRLTVLPTLRMTTAERYQYYPQANVAEQRAGEKNPQPVFGRPQQILGELIQNKLARAVYSKRQLQEVMTDFWFNHFNVFAQKGAALWAIPGYEREAIRPYALGKFRELLAAAARHPAMLFYLDNWISSAPDSRLPVPRPQPPATAPTEPLKPGSITGAASKTTPPPPAQNTRKPGINENYARELLELHTMGVDGGYSQKDVQEVARCFTGWTIDRPNQGGGFMFREWAHDSGNKTVLGVAIAAGGGVEDGYRVIDILSRHPATARFISKKLCRRLVSDNPPAQLVERVARVFSGTDGDIRQVLRAIIGSREFNSVSAFRSKTKSPLELAASAIRALDGDTNGAPALHEWIRRMGEPLYQCQPPTGYGEESTQWLNTGVFVTRLNFALVLASNQIAGTRYEPTRLVRTADTAQTEELVNKLSAMLVHTELSPKSREAALAGLKGSSGSERLSRTIGILLGSAEFQKK